MARLSLPDFFMLAALLSAPAQGLAGEYGARAEWDRAHTILMHTPGEELFVGVLNPEAALFENTFNIEAARQEHRDYLAALKREGVDRIVTVEDLLLEGTDIPGSRARADLIALADRAVTLDLRALKPEDQARQHAAWDRLLQAADPKVLVRAIFQRPTLTLEYDIYSSADRYNILARYSVAPAMNLYFTRDQMITTRRGIVLGRMGRPQRADEIEIVDSVLRKLGVPVIHRVTEAGILEGGDFLPAGDRSFIGLGLRTNAEALQELLDNDAFGTDEVVVVKDSWRNQQEMHLDTYFNLIDADLAVLVADRYDCRHTPVKCLTADVWSRNPSGGYRLAFKDEDFVDLLMTRWKYRIIPVSTGDQKAYGINFLTLSKRKLIGVEGVSLAYKQALADAGVQAVWIDFTNMKQGYGAAHCTTQVLRRGPD